VVVALGLAGAGLYLLTAPEAGGLNRGDAWTLVTALSFGGQIVAVAHLSRRHDPLRLVWMETVVTAVGAGVAAASLEHIRLAWTPALAAALGYTAVLATAVALLWQMRAQRSMSSARAALIFCVEPVFAALASWVWFGERLSALQWTGGGLILAGMLLAEVPRVRVSGEVV
jgi:drug/metabolite transporter (DMT)-like permease